ncbi:MAG: hypothetical protein ABGX12_00435 [Desulfurobacteriaceae bacterium]
MKRIFLFLFFFLLSVSAGAVEVDSDGVIYSKGVKQFKIGSYSTALEYFLKLLKPESKYYKDSLLMLSKTYYAIARKTGKKKYLWQALNYLQLYFIAVGNGKLPWDYYYTKGRIYEALGFYEQALAVYRVAFLYAVTNEEKLKTTVGIVRTAVWVKRPDIVDQYYVLVSTAKLTPEEVKEVEFLKGLILFSQGKYRKALKPFFRVYRKYESYLIDNPEYYLLVAENVYRIGNLTFAEQLFRRIVSLTRDPAVIRKAYLRLGDIQLRRGDLRLTFVYYYTVITDYPKSEEAIVARLKIIPLMKYREVRYRAELSKEKAFKEPVKYIAGVLVNYRTTYVGIYALADLGYLVFKLNAPENVFSRLLWEISLVFPEQVKYEQREFLTYLWKPFLLKLPYDKSCLLYRSNPRFFQEIFDRTVLLKFVESLKRCNMRSLRLELLEFMLNRWKDDESRILVAQALFENKDFEEALKVLRRVEDKSACSYKKLLFKLGLFLPVKLPPLEELLKSCPGVDSDAIAVYYLSNKGNLEDAFGTFSRRAEEFLKAYDSSPVVKAALSSLLERGIEKGNYRVVYDVSKFLILRGADNCYVGSFYTISSVRLGKLKEAEKEFSRLKSCTDELSKVARAVYEDALLEERGGF